MEDCHCFLTPTTIARMQIAPKRSPPTFFDIPMEEEEENEFHIIPESDCMNHIDDYTCPCQPERTKSIEGQDVWVHREVKRSLN